MEFDTYVDTKAIQCKCEKRAKIESRKARQQSHSCQSEENNGRGSRSTIMMARYLIDKEDIRTNQK
jgi:hypothetical protein